ncbi:hypothetical protein AB0M47_17080 [Hamadaea sp. NPDC051192]|uniref:hypothetical protein n=1 Tax=Hamadaea sp. NPDC051192 TaxID=3154940 RepID=UPI003436FA47
MTVKLTISLPDDLAAIAQAQPNTSAYVAEALRQRVRTEALNQAIEQAAIDDVSEEELAKIIRRHREVDAMRDDPEFRARNAATLERWRQGIIP